MGLYIKESVIINQAFECHFINLGTSRSVNEIRKNPVGKVRRYFIILWHVFIVLVKFKPNLCYMAIYAWGIAFYKDSLIVMLIKFFGVKLVYHFHNKGVSANQHKWLNDLLYQQVFINTEVLLLSKYLYPDIQKYVSKDCVHFCPNGIPEPQLETRNLKSETQNSTVELLFLSNLTESKGVFILLQACKLLKEKKLSFHCTFVGGEGDITKGQFHQQVKEFELNDMVHYIGSKYGREKEAAFIRADIFAFPTYYECFPLVLLEAMLYSLPVISTYEGGIPDIVKNNENGILVPLNDPINTARAIQFLLENDDVRRIFGHEGRKHVNNNFSMESVATKLCKIYENITL